MNDPWTTALPPPAVFLQEPLHERAPQPRRPGGPGGLADPAGVAAVLSRLAHRALVGSGLRTREVGAVVASAGSGLPLRASSLAEEVALQLTLGDAHPCGVGGPLSLYHALTLLASGIEARHFSHALLLHAVAASDGAATDCMALVLGTTPGALRYLGVELGRSRPEGPVPDEDEGPAARLAERLRLAEASLAPARWGAAGDQGGALLLELAAGGRRGQRAVVAARDGARWAAVALEAQARPDAVRPTLDDPSLSSHLRRAALGEFPLTLLRLVVTLPAGGGAGGAADELLRRIRGAVRAFDDVTRLPDGSVVVVLPRARARELGAARERLAGALRGLDPAGELAAEWEVHEVTIEPGAPPAAGVIEQALGLPAPR